MASKLESRFQSELKKRLYDMFPECIVLKNDANSQQGIPDLVVLWRDKWALLEVKRNENATEQPNQRWFVDKANEFAYGAIVCPENAEEILYELQQAFQPRG